MPDTNKKQSRCFGHPECVMTAGYSIGGGHYICWLHILQVPGGILYYRSKPVIMPTLERQEQLAIWRNEDLTMEERMKEWAQLSASRQH